MGIKILTVPGFDEFLKTAPSFFLERSVIPGLQEKLDNDPNYASYNIQNSCRKFPFIYSVDVGNMWHLYFCQHQDQEGRTLLLLRAYYSSMLAEPAEQQEAVIYANYRDADEHRLRIL